MDGHSKREVLEILDVNKKKVFAPATNLTII